MRVRAADREGLVGTLVAGLAADGLTDVSVSRSTLEGAFIALTGRGLLRE
ncbi:hypothetical protein [Egicoccus sp. AB-alg2]